MLPVDRPALLLATLMVEAVIGYPAAVLRAVGHPVMWVGRLIAVTDRHWNTGSPNGRRAMGIAATLLLLLVGGGTGWLIEAALSGWSGAAALALICTSGLAQRGLNDHVVAVARPLLAGNLDAARAALAMIVGRDTTPLDAGGMAAAATETLAESFCDGVVAPAFWFLILGLPGLFAFKCISTADSMIGHLDDRHRQFGWAAARTDDVMNWIPARLSGLLLCLAGVRGWQIMWRDAQGHLSPNAGWPESAMAGALSVRLGGGATYDGEWIARATLGDGARPTPDDVPRALAVYRRACLLLWLLVALVWGALAWPR